MKMTVEIDCTPEEARAFMGLPDVSGLNAKMVEEMQNRMTENMARLSSDELMKSWSAFGVGAQEQFRKLMTQAVDMGMSATRPK
jgi:hypothetical protein